MSLSKLGLDWETLPGEMKMEVVKWLDYESRCRLERTSIGNYQIIKAVPIRISQMHVKTGSKSTGTGILCEIKPYISERVPSAQVLETFQSLFEHKASQIDELQLGSNSQGDTRYGSEFYHDLCEEMGRRHLIRIRKLEWNCTVHMGGVLVNVLECLDPNTLKTLHCTETLKSEPMRKLMATKQWKSLEEVEIGSTSFPMHIEQFWHFKNFRIVIPRLTEVDAWRLIKHRRSLPLSAHSFFYVGTHKPFEDTTKILEQFDVKPKNEPVLNTNRENVHTQRFRLAHRDDLVLIVEIKASSIEGYALFKEHISDYQHPFINLD
ncbi:unnamed protein product [Caenorhabditis sp. 36 PRJEB53466]|nr:unnamed protein product [Caenorhabditis sp. 36 PRJEB53466]